MSVAPEKEEANYAQSYEVEGLRDRVRRLEGKVRMLIGVLIDKNVVGKDFGAALVSETKQYDEVVKWFLKLQEKKDNA